MRQGLTPLSSFKPITNIMNNGNLDADTNSRRVLSPWSFDGTLTEQGTDRGIGGAEPPYVEAAASKVMYDTQIPPEGTKGLFDGDSFFSAEYRHWIKTARTYSSITFHTTSMELLRTRILQQARQRGNILETTKINDTTLKVTYTGDL